MSVKDESKAAGRKAGSAPAPRAEADAEDIANLLRALNDDLKLDSVDDFDPDTLDEEPEAKAERRLPVGMITVALLAAMGIGFGVVMFDRESAGDPQSAPQVAGAGAPTAEPQPLITRPDLAPQTAMAPKPAAPASTPVPASAPAPAPAPIADTTAAVVPAPAVVPEAPAPAIPVKIPEPPHLPDPAAQVANQAPKPAAAPPARLADNPPPAPAVPDMATPKPSEIVPAPSPTAAAPAAPAVPDIATPKPSETVPAPSPTAAEPAAPPTPTPAAPAATAEASGKADAGALQAMLAPPEPAKPEIPTAGPSATAPTTPAAVRPAPPRTVPGPAFGGGKGRYTIQVGSFQVTENADALVRRLQSSGLQAYALNWTDSAQRTWRVVRIGQYASSDEAQRAAGELQSNVPGLTPIVVGTR